MPADSAGVGGCVSATVAAIRKALRCKKGYEASRMCVPGDELVSWLADAVQGRSMAS